MLHSFTPYKGNHLKIHPNFSTQRLSRAPDPSETWPWCQHRFSFSPGTLSSDGHSPSSDQLLEMQWPCWTHYPCCQQLAGVHTDQIQLVCKDTTGSFEEKSTRFPKEANIAQDECCRRGPLRNTGKENFNSGYGSNVNSCFAVHRAARVLTVMWSKTINWRLCISGQKSQQQGWTGRKGRMCQTESSASRTPSLMK